MGDRPDPSTGPGLMRSSGRRRSRPLRRRDHQRDTTSRRGLAGHVLRSRPKRTVTPTSHTEDDRTPPDNRHDRRRRHRAGEGASHRAVPSMGHLPHPHPGNISARSARARRLQWRRGRGLSPPNAPEGARGSPHRPRRCPRLPPRSRVRGPSRQTPSSAASRRADAACLAEVVEHQHGAPDRAAGVRDALAGDVGRRAVHRLEQCRARRRPGRCWRSLPCPCRPAALRPGRSGCRRRGWRRRRRRACRAAAPCAPRARRRARARSGRRGAARRPARRSRPRARSRSARRWTWSRS